MKTAGMLPIAICMVGWLLAGPPQIETKRIADGKPEVWTIVQSGVCKARMPGIGMALADGC